MIKFLILLLKHFLLLVFGLLFSFSGYSQTPASAYKTVAQDGAWCWFSDPRAIYHKGQHEQIYYGYINSQGDVVLSARDEKTQVIHTFILHEKLQIDDHNVPAILFLPDGKILTFYTEHNGRFFMRKSKRPEDITEWEEEKIINFNLPTKRLCYAHPVMLSGENNRIYLFFRGTTPGQSFTGWGQYFTYSDDLGNTWQDGRYYLDTRAINNAPYLKVTSDNKSRIDFVFTDGHPKIGPASVYHMFYQKGKFHQTNGNIIASLHEVPLQLSKINKVYDVNVHQTKAWFWDIALDKNNRPVIAYARYPSVHEHIYYYTRWNGKKWIDRQVVNAGGYITKPEKSGKVLEEHYSGGIVLDHHKPDNVYLSRQINGTFEIEHWQLKGDNWKTTALTQNSTANNIRPYVVADYAGKKPLVMWMHGRYEHYTRYKTDLLINMR